MDLKNECIKYDAVIHGVKINYRLKATHVSLSPLVAKVSCLGREFKDAAAEP